MWVPMARRAMGALLNTNAINAAVADCNKRGGGTVVVDSGTYRTGTIRLLDNITLKLEPGSTILGSEDLADYPKISKASEDRDTALIIAEHVAQYRYRGRRNH